MKNILLTFIVFSSFYLNSSERFDASKIYNFSDEIKIKSGHVLYCAKTPYQGVKIDLWEEKFTNFKYWDESDNAIEGAPMADIENSKNYLKFKVPPHGGEGPIDDMSVWRRWYIDKINLKFSYRFFWNGKFLEPITGDCSTQPPDYISKLIN